MQQKSNTRLGRFGELAQRLSFASGFFDMGLYSRPVVRLSSESSDGDSMRSDWEAIGKDMRNAIDRYEQEQNEQETAPPDLNRLEP